MMMEILTDEHHKEALEKIRSDKIGRNYLKLYLTKHYADENLLFLEAVENFENAGEEEDLLGMALEIADEFLREESPREVNIQGFPRAKVFFFLLLFFFYFYFFYFFFRFFFVYFFVYFFIYFFYLFFSKKRILSLLTKKQKKRF